MEETQELQAYKDLASALFNLGASYFNSMHKQFGFFKFKDKQKKIKAKELFERVVELGKNSSDEHLNGLAKKAQDILDKQI